MTALAGRSIIGPLTTTFTPAPACTVVVEECNTCDTAWQAQTCFSSRSGSSTNFGVQDGAECWPPGSGSVTTPTPPLAGWGFYSPGLICPIGSTSACFATAGGSSGWHVQFSMIPGETAVGCCPRYERPVRNSYDFASSVLKENNSGYSCVAPDSGNGVQTCLSIATSTSFPLVSCESGTSGGFQYYTLPLTISSTTISTYSLLAPMIQINWQSSDRPATTTAVTTSSAPTGTTTVSPTSSSQAQSGLSTGAKAGLGVGIALGVIAIALVSFLLYNRHNSKYGRAGQHSPTSEGVYELRANEGSHGKSELPSHQNNVHELPHEEVQGISGPISELASS